MTVSGVFYTSDDVLFNNVMLLILLDVGVHEKKILQQKLMFNVMSMYSDIVY